MELTQTLFNDIKKHCTSELLSYVGNISIRNDAENQWDITALIDADDNLYEILKILYVFEKFGGSLMYKGEIEIFPVIIRNLNNPKFLGIHLFWECNEINGDVPIFDIGELEIPKIMPKFTAIPFEDGFYYIEKREGNNRVRLENEKFFTFQEAKDKAAYLNSIVVDS